MTYRLNRTNERMDEMIAKWNRPTNQINKLRELKKKSQQRERKRERGKGKERPESLIKWYINKTQTRRIPRTKKSKSKNIKPNPNKKSRKKHPHTHTHVASLSFSLSLSLSPFGTSSNTELSNPALLTLLNGCNVVSSTGALLACLYLPFASLISISCA